MRHREGTDLLECGMQDQKGFARQELSRVGVDTDCFELAPRRSKDFRIQLKEPSIRVTQIHVCKRLKNANGAS